jgi:hypothetical protein
MTLPFIQNNEFKQVCGYTNLKHYCYWGKKFQVTHLSWECNYCISQETPMFFRCLIFIKQFVQLVLCTSQYALFDMHHQTVTWIFIVFFLICIVGGGIKVHSTLQPLNGLLYQPRVTMIMEKSVEWLAGETEVLGENLPQCRFVHHKPHMLARVYCIYHSSPIKPVDYTFS